MTMISAETMGRSAPSRAISGWYWMIFTCSRATWLPDSAAEPRRTTMRLRGSPVLAPAFSRPTASDCTMTYTQTTSAMPSTVKRVARQRTKTLRKL